MDVLAELTRILPPPTWLKLLEISPAQVVVDGETDQAAPLLKVVDASPLFESSEFQMGPVPMPGGAMFRIKANRKGQAGRRHEDYASRPPLSGLGRSFGPSVADHSRLAVGRPARPRSCPPPIQWNPPKNGWPAVRDLAATVPQKRSRAESGTGRARQARGRTDPGSHGGAGAGAAAANSGAACARPKLRRSRSSTTSSAASVRWGATTASIDVAVRHPVQH